MIGPSNIIDATAFFKLFYDSILQPNATIIRLVKHKPEPEGSSSKAIGRKT
jgi:hypothetical protein